MQELSNNDISIFLSEIADRLHHQKANPYRITAYRNAAKKVKALERNLADIADYDHIEEMIALPTIGKSIANVIIEYVSTGSSQFMDRIMGHNYIETVFDEIPGIGPHLSHLIKNGLKINTLEELKEATIDGRLDRLKGFGPKRMMLINMALASMLDKNNERKTKILHEEDSIINKLPDISIILKLDYLYRNKAKRGELHKLTPKRNNPNQESWLPIYHKEINGWHFTCLYSNTLRAHELNKTKDWVIIYYEKEGHENQSTVVTETKGELIGMRVVRGREQECHKYYAQRHIQEL